MSGFLKFTSGGKTLTGTKKTKLILGNKEDVQKKKPRGAVRNIKNYY